MEMNYERVREWNEDKRADAAFLAKWYGYLFWLIIPTVIGNIMTNETVVELLPALWYPGEVLSVCTSLVWAVILIKLKKYSDKLNFAGLGMIGLAAFGALEGTLLSHLQVGVIVSLIAAVFSLVVSYHEYFGHGEVLSAYDMELSEKWKKLWKWEITILGALVGSIVLAVIIPFLGALAVMVLAVATMVVAILKWVYLYQTKQFFTEYEIQEKYKEIPPLVTEREDERDE